MRDQVDSIDSLEKLMDLAAESVTALPSFRQNSAFLYEPTTERKSDCRGEVSARKVATKS